MTSVPTPINPRVERAPYYIVAPRYIGTSAGIRALHLLCHWLNLKGERAFMALQYVELGPNVSFDLQTPILTPEIVDYHYQQGLQPIVIYPEVVAGNPLEADCVVRWLLNFPGLLGGNNSYPASEMLIGFSKTLSDSVGEHVPVMHIPVINESVFNPGKTPQPRKGSAFYAMKYKVVHDGKVFGIPPDAIEITRDLPNSQTPEEIAQILRSVEALYVFENTALATEAVLCGCPAVFMPNTWLDEPIALNELGWDGFAWGNDPAEIERARQTVPQGQLNYQRLVDKFFVQLDAFRAASQAKAAELPYTHKVTLKFLVPSPSADIKDIPNIVFRAARQHLRRYPMLVRLRRFIRKIWK